jgi:hypothetical protein
MAHPLRVLPPFVGCGRSHEGTGLPQRSCCAGVAAFADVTPIHASGIGVSERMHENFQRREKIKGSSDRSFGLVFAAVFALVAFLPLLRAPHQPRWWAAVIAAAFALVALLWPKRLAVLNRLWLQLGLLLHAVVSPVVLALLYYSAIVPVGLLKRMFGKDSLRLQADQTASTYWITRDSSESALSSMKQQF